jgi:uncharacterized RDD family membrane protein YckC
MIDQTRVAAMEHTNLQGQYAGFDSRSIAFGLDIIIVSLVSILFTAFVSLIIHFFGLNSIITDLTNGRFQATLQEISLLIGAVFMPLFSLGYFLFFWVVAGFTPGKGLLGLRVVRSNRQPVTIGPALLRYIGYWVSALFLFLGFLWVIVDRRRQGWHDKIGRTIVVYNRQSSRQ